MEKLLVLALAFSSPAFAQQLTCSGSGEKFTIEVTANRISTSSYGNLTRHTQDQDCGYRSNHYACYEDGQVMINIPLALAEGTVKRGSVYIQSDADDNIDAHNHALLGVPYICNSER